MMFASIVLRDSIRIAFLVAALNDLEVLSADVAGVYLNAKSKERVYTIASKEFGPDKQGRPVLLTRVLYGSSRKAFRDHMATTLWNYD
jgi:hypothetical protein